MLGASQIGTMPENIDPIGHDSILARRTSSGVELDAASTL